MQDSSPSLPELIVRLKSEGRAAPLIAVLGDEARSTEERAAAATVLAEIGDPSALEALVAAARDRREPDIAEAGVAALGTFTGATVTTELISSALQLWTTHARRDAAVEALVGACRTRGGAELLESWLDPSDWQSFRPLVAALRALGGPGAERLLRQHLFDGQGTVRSRVARALADLGWPSDAADAPLAFHVIVEDWDACLAFGDVALPAMVERAHRGPERKTTAGAATALARAGSQASRGALLDLGILLAEELAGEEDPRREQGVAERLDSVGDAVLELGEAAAATIVRALTTEAPPSGPASRWLKGQLRWLPPEARLEAVLRRVAHAPAWTLPRLSKLAVKSRTVWASAEAVTAVFAARLDAAQTPADRVAAVDALGRIGGDALVPPLMRAWQTAGDDAGSRAAFQLLLELGAPAVAVASKALSVPQVPRRDWLITLLQHMDIPEATAVLHEEFFRHRSERVAKIIEEKTGTAPDGDGPGAEGAGESSRDD